MNHTQPYLPALQPAYALQRALLPGVPPVAVSLEPGVVLEQRTVQAEAVTCIADGCTEPADARGVYCAECEFGEGR